MLSVSESQMLRRPGNELPPTLISVAQLEKPTCFEVLALGVQSWVRESVFDGEFVASGDYGAVGEGYVG